MHDFVCNSLIYFQIKYHLLHYTILYMIFDQKLKKQLFLENLYD